MGFAFFSRDNDKPILDLLHSLNTKVDQVLAQILQVKTRETNMAADLTSLTAQVQKNTTIEESAVTLIQGIAAQLAAAKNDPAAIQSLSDQLNASATDLSAAIAANTPATA